MRGVKVFLGSDHAGYRLKEKIKKHLDRKKIAYEDLGAKKYKAEDDYPDFIIPTARKVARSGGLGIVLGYSGQGEAIAANKVKGVRAMVYYGKDKRLISLGRKHNDANVLSIGAGFVKEKEAIWAVDRFLKTKFGGEARHKRRIRKIGK